MTNTEIKHAEMVDKLIKDPQLIINSLTPQKMLLLHTVSKLCSEAGELMDAVGKHVFYDQPLNINNFVEECGDIEFYMQAARKCLGIIREETLTANIGKLTLRYPNWEYTDTKAKERLDKQDPKWNTDAEAWSHSHPQGNVEQSGENK